VPALETLRRVGIGFREAFPAARGHLGLSGASLKRQESRKN